MATFKVSEYLDIDVNSFLASGSNLNASFQPLDNIARIDGMKTAHKYVQQHNLIKSLINVYKSFVMKDARDIQAMVTQARELDQNLETLIVKLSE